MASPWHYAPRMDKDSVRFSLRLSKNMHKKIKKECRRLGCSINHYIILKIKDKKIYLGDKGNDQRI